MKSITNLSSTKSIKTTQKLINLKCKQDHFSYTKALPIKKNLSSYKQAYHSIDHAHTNQNKNIQLFKKSIAPPALDHNLLRRSLHQSRHFSQNKSINLPALKIGSTYKSSYLQQNNQKIVKGKQKDGFFIKMPWHDNPISNYKKSYQSVHVQSHLQKGKATEDHIKVIRTPFRAHSNYQQEYSSFRKSQLKSDSKDCIKSKDHLAGVNCPLKGQSEYKSRFENNKQNIGSSQKIKSNKKLNMFPDINQNKRLIGKQERLPKKSLKMKKSQSNPVQTNQVSHKRMMTNVN